MSFSPKEILKFVEENDVKFIRLTFCDISGSLKNVAIMPNELERAFQYGIPFDASCINDRCSDLLLVPDISTLSILPWRPKSGRVVRFFCSMKNMDGSDYAGDMRTELINCINSLRLDGYSCEMGTKCEFYLFELDENGEPTKIPHDKGSYLDVAPLDKCENARREICLSLEEMGLNPKSSCHKHGPAQNEIEFRDLGRVVWKEIRVSVLCGVCLAIACFAKIIVVDMLLLKSESVTYLVAFVVCATMAVTVCLAKIVGSTLPLLAKKLGFDPAVMASPIITTIVDFLSLLVYFAFATAMLGIG